MEQDAKKAIQAKNYSLGGSPLAILGSDFKNKSVQVTKRGDGKTHKRALSKLIYL